MRDKIIAKLSRELSTLKSKLVLKYDAKLLSRFLDVEKELEIQQMLKLNESK